MTESKPLDPSERSLARVLVRFAQRMMSLGGFLLCLGTAVAVARIPGWPWALAQHLRFLFFVGLVLALIFELLGRRWRWALLMAAGVVCNAWVIVPFYVGTGEPKLEAASDQRRLVVAQYNVRTGNRCYDLVVESLSDHGADVVGLLEVSEAWIDRLAAARAAYPHRVERPRSDNFGIALWSKHPIDNVEVLRFGGMELPTIAARVTVDGRPVEVLLTHLIPPRRGLGDLQERQLGDLLDQLSGPRAPDFVMGDLNLSPWTDAYDRLTAGAYRDARLGFGVMPSWPDLFGMVWIPIDHLLVRERIGVEAARIGPAVGSDHRPVFATLRF